MILTFSVLRRVFEVALERHLVGFNLKTPPERQRHLQHRHPFEQSTEQLRLIRLANSPCPTKSANHIRIYPIWFQLYSKSDMHRHFKWFKLPIH